MKKRDNLRLKGVVEISVIKNGRVINYEKKDNLIVSVGKDRVEELIGGTSTSYFNYIAIGTGTTSPSDSDTSLVNEVKRAQATVTHGASGEVFEKTFDFDSAESYNITELGIFDQASGGTMLDRITFSAKAVDVDTSLLVRVTISVS